MKISIFLIPGFAGSVIDKMWPLKFYNLFNLNRYTYSLGASYTNFEFIPHTASSFLLETGGYTDIKIYPTFSSFFYEYNYMEKIYLELNSHEDISVSTLSWDFRTIPTTINDYFDKIYSALDNSPTDKNVVIAHSLGGTLFHHFLCQQTEEWKQNKISHFFTIASPFGGSIKALQSLIDNVIDFQRYRIPNANYFGGLLTALPDVDLSIYTIWNNEPLSVTYNRHHYDYRNSMMKNNDINTTIIYSPDDEIVEIESLLFPQHFWNSSNVSFQKIEGGHLSILISNDLIDLIKNYLLVL